MELGYTCFVYGVIDIGLLESSRRSGGRMKVRIVLSADEDIKLVPSDDLVRT